MADITAKRGPINPNDYTTNQGVATQSQLRGLDRDIRYHENQPSTWDSVMGGIKDVVQVGKGVMDIANSYKDLDVKDEAIEKSKLDRQKMELDMEKTRQTMKYQAIKNDLELTEYRKNNAFVTDFSNAVSSYDYNKVVQLALSDPRSAAKNSGMLLYTANNLESMGLETEASQLRMVASQSMSVDQLQKMYDLPKVGASAALSQQKLDYENFKNLSEVFQNGIIRNGINNIPEITENPNLILSNDIRNELLQNCWVTSGANAEQVDAINSILNKMSGKNNELQSLESDLTGDNNKYQSALNKLSYAVVSCKDPHDPNKVVDRILAYDGKAKQQIAILDKYGNPTGKYENITNDEVVSRIASTQTKAKNARDNLMKAPNTTPNTTPNEDANKGEQINSNKAKFSELPKTTQEIITKNNKKSFDEYQKDMREEITKNSVPDEQGNTVIGKDIVNWGLEDLKDKVVKILQKDPETSNVANKVAEQEVWVAANKAGNYFVANDIVPNVQQKVEQTAYILSEKYPELNSSKENIEEETIQERKTEQDYKNPYKESKETGKSLYQIAKERKEVSKKELQNRFKNDEPAQINKDLYDTFKYHSSLLSTPMSMNTIYNNSIKSLKDSGQDVSISKSKIEQAIGKSIQKVMFNNYAGKEIGGEKINSAKDFPRLQQYSVGNKLSKQIFEVLKTDYPEIYKLLIKGINYNSEKNKQERDKKELRKNFNF